MIEIMSLNNDLGMHPSQKKFDDDNVDTLRKSFPPADVSFPAQVQAAWSLQISCSSQSQRLAPEEPNASPTPVDGQHQ